MSPLPIRLNIQPSSRTTAVDSMVFETRALEAGLAYRRNDEVAADPGCLIDQLPGPAHLHWDERNGRNWSCVLELDSAILHVRHIGGFVHIDVAAASEATADQLTADLRTLVESSAPQVVHDKVPFTFTANRSSWTTEVDCPDWEDVERNYVPTTRALLNDLFAWRDAPTIGGRLIVWHGPPGVGKTTAIRGLARRWRSWCEPTYIVDPEAMFRDADYFVSVISSRLRPIGSRGADKKRLIIAEDCDDYLHADARIRDSAGLGRLLNLTDGLLAIGSNAYVLVTTNEPVAKLHPALTRPGRILANIPFGKFTPEQAAQWGVSGASSRAHTLAELYAAKSGRHPITAPARRIGFDWTSVNDSQRSPDPSEGDVDEHRSEGTASGRDSQPEST